jgi:3-oxoacyl-[acyl-carrier-protein] synthase-3
LKRVIIRGTGSYLPPRIVPNSWFETIVDTSDEWIASRTGIRERRMIEPGQAMSDLATPAAQAALEAAGVTADQLDLIIIGTSTADMLSPSCGCLVQNNLGATKAVAFDVNAACPGFLYGLTVAKKFMQDGSHRLVLVVGGEVVSTRIDYQDRTTCVLFADGAGAAVLEAVDNEGPAGVIDTQLGSNGALWNLLYVPGGGSRFPPTHEMIDQRLPYVKMQGNEVFKHAVRLMSDSCQEILARNGLTAADVDVLIPHQANLRIIEAVGKKLDIPLEKAIVTVHKYGNSSAATIPTALDEVVRQGRIKPGDLVLCCSFGAGFVWGSALLKM